MNTIRSYKLRQLGIEIDPIEKEIIQFLESTFKGLKVVELESFKNFVYYFNNNDQCILEIMVIDDSASICYKNVWKVLQNMSKYFNNAEIEELIKYWLKKEYGLDMKNIFFDISDMHLKIVEADYKTTLK